MEDNRIVKSKPDQPDPRGEGYCCRKGLAVGDHRYQTERLTHSLKRVGERFVPGWYV